jgi:hypothetical protein
MTHFFSAASIYVSHVCHVCSVLRVKISRILCVILAFGTLSARTAHAAPGSFQNPLAVDTLWDFLLLILNAVTYIMFPIIVLMIVYTGFLFVSAQGNPSKIQEARRALVWTVVGALVILGSRALALVISATVATLQV